jgi:four helix bundle protein
MKLVAFEVSLQVVRQLQPVIAQIRMHDSHIAEQLARAAKNTSGNLAEGQRREAGNKRRAYENAHGEAREALGWLEVAEAAGMQLDDAEVRRTMDRLLGLLWGLTHPKKE